MKVVTVRPIEGRLIFMPDRAWQPVPQEGVKVFLDPFYTRTIQQGDLEIVSEEVPSDEPAVSPSK